MYISPSTDIYLLENVPLDNDYKNTIWFDNQTQQANYFMGKAVQRFNNQSYQRVGNGVLRVQVLADNVYTCNYLMFKNTLFGNKWFYGFIVGVEYINNAVTEITYQIDVMQTWHFNYTLGKCFVIREHTATDGFYEHTIPEGLNVNYYVTMTEQKSEFFDDYVAVVMSTLKTDGSNVVDNGSDEDNQTRDGDVNPGLQAMTGKILDNVWCGTFIRGYRNIEDYGEFFTKVSSKGTQDGVVCTYMVPAKFIEGYEDGSPIIDIKSDPPNSTLSTTVQKWKGTLDGYQPRNRKMYIYPYCYLLVTSFTDSQEYHFERFKHDVCIFTERCTLLPNPVGMTWPRDYENGMDDRWSSLPYSVKISNFPICAYSIDSYKAWYAQNANTIEAQQQNNNYDQMKSTAGLLLSGAALVGGAAVGAAFPAAIPALVGAGGKLASTMQNSLGGMESAMKQKNILNAGLEDAKVIPASATKPGISDCLTSLGKKTFFYITRTCDYESAKAIDEYFTMYGYTVKSVKVPNRNVRPNFTYTQTQDCNLSGNLPADDAQTIRAVYNQGVTFWKNPDGIGNYSLPNEV